jgi:Protein of unknown function (DUF3631)
LLNEGHAKGSMVLRVLGDKLELREFTVFGAVAFARNGKMPDDLEQRSIVIELHRRKADDIVEELRPDRCQALERIARMAARWCEDHRAEVAEADPDMHGLINRVADNWRPLFAIAEVVGGDWPERVLAAAEALAPRESESIGPMLLSDVRALFDAKGAGDKIPSAHICEELAAMEGRPWAEWKGGKPITANQLARLLKPFRIAPENMRMGDHVQKGYQRHQFEEAWATYLAPVSARGENEPLHRYKADETRVSDAFRSATRENLVAAPKSQKPASNGDCSGVAVEMGGGPDDGDACAHCGFPGTLLEAYDNGHEVRLHRDCIDQFMADALAHETPA